MNLKEKMIEEINSYIKRTKDYDLDYFISNNILDHMSKTKEELIWYPIKRNENNYVEDISIQNS